MNRWRTKLLEKLQGSFEGLRSDIEKALRPLYGERQYPWIRGTYPDKVVFEVDTGAGAKMYERSWSMDASGNITLGDATEVEIVEQVTPITEALRSTAMLEVGRVLSAKNEKELKAAMENLLTVLKAVAPAEEDVDPQPAPAKESSPGTRIDIESVPVKLVEKSVGKDGTIPIKIIDPGQGTSGYYTETVIKRDIPKVFPKGTKMYADHPTKTEEAERPERSIKDLVATTTETPTWDPAGADGPGMYSRAKLVSPQFAEALPLIYDSIGLSIKAGGWAKPGKVDGKDTLVVESIDEGTSIDFVTGAGRGGKVLSLVESAVAKLARQEEEDMDEETVKRLIGEAVTPLQTALTEANTKISGLETENARLREGDVRIQARKAALAELKDIALMDVTKDRIAESIAANPPMAEGKLDQAKLTEAVSKAVEDEQTYLKEVGAGRRITDMGLGLVEADTEPAAVTKSYTESTRRIFTGPRPKELVS